MKDPISEFLGTAVVAKTYSAKVVDESDETIETDNSDKSQTKYEDNLKEDYEFARRNIKELIRESMSILPELSSLVVQMQLPDGYAQCGKFVKDVVDANTKLIGLTERQLNPVNKKSKDNLPVVSEEKAETTTNNVVNNTLLINMTAEQLLTSILDKEIAMTRVVQHSEN